MPLTQEKTVLSLRGITKQFPGVLANDDINFDLLEGEVHTIPVSYTHLTLPTTLTV